MNQNNNVVEGILIRRVTLSRIKRNPKLIKNVLELKTEVGETTWEGSMELRTINYDHDTLSEMEGKMETVCNKVKST